MKTQLRLEAFYTFNERFAKIRSKRIKKAVKGITRSQTSELLDDAVQEGSESGKRSKESPSKLANKQEIPKNEIGSTAARNESNATGKTTPKQSRGRRVHKRVPSDVESAEPPVQAGCKQGNYTGSRKNGRGKGRKKGPAVGRVRGRARIQENPGSEISATSSSDCDGGNEEEVPAQKLEGSNEVRRVSFSLSCNSIYWVYIVVLIEIELRNESPWVGLVFRHVYLVMVQRMEEPWSVHSRLVPCSNQSKLSAEAFFPYLFLMEVSHLG